jgi:hypothetical protein
VTAEHQRAEQEQQAAWTAQQQAQAAQLEAQNAQANAKLAQQQQQQAQTDRQIAETEAQQEQAQVAAMRDQAVNAQNEALKIRTRDEWFMGVFAVVAVLILAILWRLMRQQRPAPVPVSVPARLERMEKPAASIPPAELAPYLAQTLKEVVVQGLAAQRAELLESQRLAATEIAELVHRLDSLQTPMQERLRAYQDRIQELQKELEQRTEENRELLKMKIEMMRRQLETERTRVKLN